MHKGKQLLVLSNQRYPNRDPRIANLPDQGLEFCALLDILTNHLNGQTM